MVCQPNGEHKATASAPHDEPLLTAHVLQEFQTRYSSSPSSAQHSTTSSSPSSPLPQHPSSFSFPTLNLDGSLSDLSLPQANRRYPRTPPAALSSLGAKARMAHHSESASDSDLTDSQYDMIDDLSEISNDDHDTASIASNGDEDRATIEDAVSELDADESTLLPDEQPIFMPSSTSHSFVDLQAQSFESIEDPTSQELETPRQSAMPVRPASNAVTSNQPETMPLSASTQDANRILFVSREHISRPLMDELCSDVAAAMNPSRAGDAIGHDTSRVPVASSRANTLPVSVIRGKHGALATVQHCVHTLLRSKDTYSLLIKDSDGEHSSFFTVGADAKLDLAKPDIAVFYLDEQASGLMWLSLAIKAIRTLKVPVLVVRSPSFEATKPPKALRSLLDNSVAQYNIGLQELREMTSSSLSLLLSQLSEEVTLPVVKPRGKAWGLKLGMLVLLFPLICLSPLMVAKSLLWSISSSSNQPVVALAAQRSYLAEALSQATTSTNVTQDFNINHLLPETSTPCTDCSTKFHYQAVLPNYFVVSLLRDADFPEVTSGRVFKDGGRYIDFNHSQLIRGVHLLTFDPDEAYGTVTVNMLTRKPYLNVTASHDYGRRVLQRTGKEVGKVVSRDVAIMRSTAKALTDKFSLEFGAGVSATKNITTQLALYVSRDLQVWSSSAASFLGKAARAGNRTAINLNKDFLLVQRDVVRFTKDLSTRVMSTVAQAKNNSKALIRNPLAVSRQRVQSLRKAFAHRQTTKAQISIPTTESRPASKGRKCGNHLRDHYTKKDISKAKRKLKKAARVVEKSSRVDDKMRRLQEVKASKDHRKKMKQTMKAKAGT